MKIRSPSGDNEYAGQLFNINYPTTNQGDC